MNSETVLDMSFVPCMKLINNISCKIFKFLVVNRTLFRYRLVRFHHCKFPLLFLAIKFSFSSFMIEIVLLTVELAVP